jgi:5'-methylthioadenosine phosphorylase
LKEEIEPRDLIIPNQLIDHTKGRANTFFGGGVVAHVGFAEPFCPILSQILYQAAKEAGARVHKGGTYVVIEGPQFSTKAESNLYRSWGASIIGMTALPEAKLAREAEICYATLASVTDYDCWHESYGAVTAGMIVANLQRNVDVAKRIIKIAVSHIPEKRECSCATALKDAIITLPEYIPSQLKGDLAPLIGKYVA